MLATATSWPPTFLQSSFTSKVEYEEWKARLEEEGVWDLTVVDESEVVLVDEQPGTAGNPDKRAADAGKPASRKKARCAIM